MKDPSAKNVTISVKVSRAEAAALKAIGKTSPGKGLRHLIDKYLHRSDTT